MQDTRALNRAAVLTELLLSRPTTRQRIAQKTGISAATVSRLIDQLIIDGVIEEGPTIVSESRGRRATQLDFVSTRAFVVGIDLGASNTRIVIADLLARRLDSCQLVTPHLDSPEELGRWVAESVVALAGERWPLVEAISLGLPGAVHMADRTVGNAPNLPLVEDSRFLKAVEAGLGKSVEIDNDANYALVGEQRFGAAKFAATAAMMTLGAGLGAALALDGKIIRGRRGLIGEFGHLPIGPSGARLENMVTGPGILREAADAGLMLTEPSQLFEPGTEPSRREVRAHFDQSLLVVLTALYVSCEPEVIVLGGGIATALGHSLGRYEEALFQNLESCPRLVQAQLGVYSGAIGACVASVHRVYAALGVSPEALSSLPATT